MENNEFYDFLSQNLEMPFEIEDVISVEENCGTVWIQMKDNRVYYLKIEKCEDDE